MSKSCGHVTCKTCFDTLIKPAKQCVVCDKELKVEKDVVELKREGTLDKLFAILYRSLFDLPPMVAGTGFAGGGLAETSKSGIAFQG